MAATLPLIIIIVPDCKASAINLNITIINASNAGDTYHGDISGGNVGGRGNTYANATTYMPRGSHKEETKKRMRMKAPEITLKDMMERVWNILKPRVRVLKTINEYASLLNGRT
ncbi:hypothetical protein ONZ45_g2903 [Pleurotus djamor]|nr:hypothetical protein ONZ45_g2903 [Pleurotus djamor]